MEIQIVSHFVTFTGDAGNIFVCVCLCKWVSWEERFWEVRFLKDYTYLKC